MVFAIFHAGLVGDLRPALGLSALEACQDVIFLCSSYKSLLERCLGEVNHRRNGQNNRVTLSPQAYS